MRKLRDAGVRLVASAKPRFKVESEKISKAAFKSARAGREGWKRSAEKFGWNDGQAAA